MKDCYNCERYEDYYPFCEKRCKEHPEKWEILRLDYRGDESIGPSEKILERERIMKESINH